MPLLLLLDNKNKDDKHINLFVIDERIKRKDGKIEKMKEKDNQLVKKNCRPFLCVTLSAAAMEVSSSHVTMRYLKRSYTLLDKTYLLKA